MLQSCGQKVAEKWHFSACCKFDVPLGYSSAQQLNGVGNLKKALTAEDAEDAEEKRRKKYRVRYSVADQQSQ
jgi:hypothetical protein